MGTLDGRKWSYLKYFELCCILLCNSNRRAELVDDGQLTITQLYVAKYAMVI